MTEQHEQPKGATPAREWGNALEGYYTLPGCGNVARLRRPSIAAMMAKVGQIPNAFSEEITRFVAVSDLTERPTAEQQIESYRKYVRAYIDMARLVFVEPRFVLEPDHGNGEIGPHDLTEADYVWIWREFIQGRAEDLRPFRVG